jgi:flavin-dependent dehydrogenase
MTRHYDAIVVGARVAGSATAMLLARGGADVLVVDRGAYGSDTGSTHALMRAGVLQLTRWGLLDGVVAAGTPPVRKSRFHYEDGTSVVSIVPAAGVDALYAPRRTVIDRLLVDAATTAGAHYRFGTTVQQLIREPDGRVIGVVARDAEGRDVEARAPITVGADGINSFVARALDVPVTHRGRGAGSVTYGYWSGLPHEGYEWFWRPGAVAGIIPTNDGEACVFASAPPARMRAEGYESVLTAAAPGLGDALARARRPRRLRRYAGRPGFIRRAAGPGWALVGDAGYFKDPLSAHGMSDALRDAELLTRAIVAGEPARYEHERDRLSLPLFAVTDALASFGWDTEEARRLLLQLSSSMTDEVEALLALDGASAATRTMAVG